MSSIQEKVCFNVGPCEKEIDTLPKALFKAQQEAKNIYNIIIEDTDDHEVTRRQVIDSCRSLLNSVGLVLIRSGWSINESVLQAKYELTHLKSGEVKIFESARSSSNSQSDSLDELLFMLLKGLLLPC